MGDEEKLSIVNETKLSTVKLNVLSKTNVYQKLMS